MTSINPVLSPNWMSHKEGVRKALEGYYRRLAKKEAGPTRRNLKPEKGVETECLLWLRLHGFDMQVYEAKATYDPRSGHYRQQSMKAGTVDCQGIDSEAHACFIEFKAPGKLSTFWLDRNYRQQEYLISKIERGAFGCVVDGVSLLRDIYMNWRNIKKANGLLPAVNYLKSRLPPHEKLPLGLAEKGSPKP